MFAKIIKKPVSILAVALVSASAMATAAGPKLAVEQSVALAVPPAKVWSLIGDYAGLANWHPAVAEVQISKGRNNAKGAERTVTVKDGAKIVERLEALDTAHYSMRYRILSSPLPLTHYQSTLLVKAEGKGSRVIWRSRFDPLPAAGLADDKVKEIVTGIYRSGLDNLAERLTQP